MDLDYLEGLSALISENPELKNCLKVTIVLSIIYSNLAILKEERNMHQNNVQQWLEARALG